MMQAIQAMYGAADRTGRCGGIRPGVLPVESGERPDEGGNRGNGASGSKTVKGRVVKRPVKGRLLVLGACCMAAQGAHAYLDPGSGSMLLQILLGGLAGAGVLAKLYWYRIRALFGAAANNEGRKREDPALDRREE